MLFFPGKLGTVFAKQVGMKNQKIFLSAFLVVALQGAASAESMPESQLTGPVEALSAEGSRSGNSLLDAKRAERREARAWILSRLRESSFREKASVRDELSKKGNENSRKSAETPKRENFPRTLDGRRQMPDDRPMKEPGRGMPPPEFGDPKF